MTRPSLTYADRCQLNELGFVRQRDDGAERDKALAIVRAKAEELQDLVIKYHRWNGIDLLDAKHGCELVLADVDFEREREQ